MNRKQFLGKKFLGDCFGILLARCRLFVDRSQHAFVEKSDGNFLRESNLILHFVSKRDIQPFFVASAISTKANAETHCVMHVNRHLWVNRPPVLMYSP